MWKYLLQTLIHKLFIVWYNLQDIPNETRILLSSSLLMKEWLSAGISSLLDNIYQYSHTFNLSSFTSCYKSYVFSIVNLITSRMTKSCMMISNWSFVLFVSKWMSNGDVFWASIDEVSLMYLTYDNNSLFSSL